MRLARRRVFCVTMSVVNVQWLMFCVCLVALVDTITVTASTPLSPRPSQVPVQRSHDKEYQSHFAHHSQQRTGREIQLNRLRLFRTEEKTSTVDEQKNPESVATRAKVPESVTWLDFLKYEYAMRRTAVGRVAIPPRDAISVNLFSRKSQTTTILNEVKKTFRNKSLQFPKSVPSLLESKINTDKQTISVVKPIDRNDVTPQDERNVKLNMTSSQGLDDTGHAEWSMQQGQPWWASEWKVASSLPSLPARSPHAIAVNTTTTVFHLTHQSPDTIHDREQAAAAVSAWSSKTARSEGLHQAEAKTVTSLSFSTWGSRAGRELNTFTASGSAEPTLNNTRVGSSTGRTLNTSTASGCTGRTLNTSTASGCTGRTLNTSTASGCTGRTLNTSTASGCKGRTINTSTASGCKGRTINTSTASGSTGRTLNTPTASGSTRRTLNTSTASGSTGRRLNTPTASGSTRRTLNTPTASGSTGRRLNTPTASGSTRRTLNTPTASGSTGRRLNTPTASGSTGRRLNTPTASGSTGRRLNTPTASGSTGRRLNTPTASGSTGRRLNTPTASGSTGRRLNTPTASGSTGRRLNTPTASGSTGRTLNTSTASGSTRRTLNTSSSTGRTLNTSSSTGRTLNTPKAGGSGGQEAWGDEWSRVRRGTGSMTQAGRGQWFSASETCQQLEVVKVLQPPGCVRRVVRSQSCQGTCHSRSVPQWDVERQELRRVAYCTCCKPHSMTYRRIRFRCPGHDKNLVIHVGVATQCACRPCSEGTASLRQPYDY